MVKRVRNCSDNFSVCPFAESSSPQDLEDTHNNNNSDKDVNDVIEQTDALEINSDHVERIIVPEHKNQATSPGHPMAQQQEECVIITATDGEVIMSAISTDFEGFRRQTVNVPFINHWIHPHLSHLRLRFSLIIYRHRHSP